MGHLQRTPLHAAIALAATLALLAPAAGAAPAGGQHQNANVYAFWSYDSDAGFRDAAQKIKVRKKAPYTFWAQYWTWTGQSVGGYIGLQTDGNRFDGTTGETAIFSLWDADASRGSGCGTFGGEGEGHSCRLAFPIRAKHVYEVRVTRGRGTDAGQWWKGSLRDLTARKTHSIGSIRVAPEFTLMQRPMNFSEYFGPAVPCDQVPLSVVLWSSPRANQRDDGTYRVSSTRDGSSRGECTGGVVEPHSFGTRGVKITQGGPL